MTKKDREELRRTMGERAWQILHEGRQIIREATEELPVRTDVDDASEQALFAAIKTTRLDLGDRDRDLLHLIADALERLRQGSYGRCLDCGNPIGLERLRAVPWAPRCADDQERHEVERRMDTPSL
jgi:DnaK suppressor protein